MSGRKKLLKRIKIVFINTLILLILLETASVIAIYVFKFASPPSYIKSNILRGHYVDINQYFGAWHYSDISYRRVSPCYDVTYAFNSYGARDIERNRKSNKPRIAVLGDSFMEGFGIESKDRISNILENELGVEVMNFATSGGFGSTQMSIQYEKMVSEFDHTTVLIGLFPENDFYENDLENAQNAYAHLYRPYRVKEDAVFKTIYFQDSLHKSEWYPNNIRKISVHSLSDFIQLSHTGKALFKLRSKLLYDRVRESSVSWFECYSNKDLEILKHDLAEVKKFAGPVNVVVFCIPSSKDFAHYYATKPTTIRLESQLSSFCQQNEIAFINLFEKLLLEVNESNYKDLYLKCDGHFSPLGNELTAKIIKQYF